MKSISSEKSMYPVEWDDAWDIGIAEIDSQHRELIAVVNQLYEFVRDGAKPENMKAIVNRMIDYIRRHFASEERIMMKEGFDGLDEHRTIHVSLTEKLLSFRSRNITDGTIDGDRLQKLLSGWLVQHFGKDDDLFREFMRAKNKLAQ